LSTTLRWRELVRQAARRAAMETAAQSKSTTFNCRWEHVQAVVITALRLAELVGADREIVEAAAWLHDVVEGAESESGEDIHGQLGAETARALLVGTDFPPGKIEAVANAIIQHSGKFTEKCVEPLEVAVLWDADVLVKTGAIGFLHYLAGGLWSGQFGATEEVVKWVSRGEEWFTIPAIMNTAPGQQTAKARLHTYNYIARRLTKEWLAEDIQNPARSSGYATESLRQDGRDGILWSPLWRLRFELTDVERELLKTWSLRRLHFIHHNGASTFAYPLNASRLQHTLGVLALVANFCPDEPTLRVAALLHDVGHYPFCHSAELVMGVDHHEMTRRRVTSEPISCILRAHGLSPNHLLALMEGNPPNPLRTHNGLLHLDHLDSWARQAEAAGYAEMAAHELLAHLRLEGNNVAADRDTAEYLVRLVRQGNERHYAEGDIGPATVLAHTLTLAQERGLITIDELADATDEALLTRLAMAGDRQVTELIALLRQEPWRIIVRKLACPADDVSDHPLDVERPQTVGRRSPTEPLIVHLDALYDAVPILAGAGVPITQVSNTAQAEMTRVKELAGFYAVSWT
jgi:HD superfamily phosphodiesterase